MEKTVSAVMMGLQLRSNVHINWPLERRLFLQSVEDFARGFAQGHLLPASPRGRIIPMRLTGRMVSVLTISLVIIRGSSQSVTFTNASFWSHNGSIRIASNGTDIGSGFVLGPHKDVVTCKHVVDFARAAVNETNLQFVCSSGVRQLKLNFALAGYDLAVLTPSPAIDGAPFSAGNFDKVKVGDTILYLGYDTRQSKTNATTVFHLGTVAEKGAMMNEGVKVDALLFKGEGIPGYSGGAVYNTNMEIIAIITKGGAAKGADGAAQAVNVAFSIAPIADFEKAHKTPVVK